METCYVDKDHRGIADLVRPGELTPNWTITRINIPYVHRGNGYGSALLKRILADADKEQAVLQLEVFPTGALNYAELVAWYERNGFVMQATGYMRRPPHRHDTRGVDYSCYGCKDPTKASEYGK